MLTNPGPFDDDVSQAFLFGGSVDHHPMKGPMTTQKMVGPGRELDAPAALSGFVGRGLQRRDVAALFWSRAA